MRDLGDHAAHRGGVFQLTGLVHLVQAQADQRGTLVLGATDRRATCLTTMVLAMGQISLRVFGSGSFRFVAQDVGDFLAATLSHHARARLFGQAVQGGADHVVGVLRADRLRHNVLHAQHLEHGTHRTTGDDPGTLQARCA